MSKPWEQYQNTAGPWQQYQQKTSTEDDSGEPGGGLLGAAWRFATGEDRSTEATETLKMVDAAPEFSGSAQGLVKGIQGLIEHPSENLAMALTSDPKERVQIIRSIFPDAKFWQDEKGNPGVDLPSGSYMLAKPGIRTLDVVNAIQEGLGVGLMATPAGGVVRAAGMTGLKGTVAKEALAGGMYGAAQQALEASGGGNFDAPDIAFSAAGNAIFPAVGAGLRQILPARVGRAADVAPEEQKGGRSPTGEVRRAIRELGVAQTRQQEKIKAAASLVQPNADILAAGQRLGVMPDELLPHHYSDNEAFRDVIGGMASSQQWALMEVEERLLNKLDEVASDFITDNGGSLDGSIVSQEIKDALESEINGLSQRSKMFYDQVNEVISPLTKVDAPRTLEHLDNMADQYGGLDRLTSFEKDVSKDFGPDGVRTWAGFNDRRADVGDALEKTRSGDNRRDYRRSAMLYGPMSEDARDIARTHGVLNEWDTANRYYAMSEELRAAKKQLLGRDEIHDAMPRIITAMKGLSTGKTASFQTIMGLIPEDLHNQAVMTGIREMLTGGSKAADVLSLPGAVTWLRDVMENKESYQALKSYMSPGAVQQMEDIFTLFSGINRGRKSLLGDTGNKLKDLAKAIAAEGGFTRFTSHNPIASRVGKSALILKASPMGGVAVRAMSDAMEGASDALVARAADLIITPQFTKLATAIDGRAPGEQINQLHDELVKTPQFKAWFKDLVPETKSAVRRGFTQWLISEIEAEQGRQDLTEQ